MSARYVAHKSGLNVEVQVTSKRRVCERNQLFALVETLASEAEKAGLSRYLEQIVISHAKKEAN